MFTSALQLNYSQTQSKNSNSEEPSEKYHITKTLKYWVMSSRVNLTSWGGVSLAPVGHPSSDGFMIKIPCGVDALLH